MPNTPDLFAQHNLRCTAQRQALYEALLADRSHPSAEELYRTVKPRTARLSRATVYNTLETLCRVGLARRLPTDDGCCRYDADTSQHLHVLFREDGSIRDVPVQLGSRLVRQLPAAVIAQIEGALGAKVDGIAIQLLARRAASESPGKNG